MIIKTLLKLYDMQNRGHEFKKIKNDFDNLRIALHCSKCSLKVYFFWS